MKVILTQDIKSIGKRGEVKEVAEGYARNFLFPKKMAIMATQSGLKEIELLKERERSQSAELTKKHRQLANELKDKVITISSKEKDGKLFGSVTPKEIAQKILAEGFAIPKEGVTLDEPIKKIGKYAIKIKLADDVDTHIILNVVGEK